MQLRNFTKLTGTLMNLLIYANLCKCDLYFSKRREIDKAQLILGRSGLELN